MSILGWTLSRWLTHAALILFAVIVYAVTAALKPNLRPLHMLTIATGYGAYLLLVLTLVIGTWQLWRKQARRNPVNLYVRRDVGIWCGLLGVVHIIIGFQVHLGGDVIAYFFDQGRLRFDLFGFANDTGLVAALILVALLVISNDGSMRLLKGRRWKNIQRLNYVLFALVLAHTLAYQNIVRRESALVAVTLALAMLVLGAQAAGIRWMNAKSKAHHIKLQRNGDAQESTVDLV